MLQRTLVRKGRRVRLAVTALDSVGALARIAAVIARGGGNIVNVTPTSASSATMTPSRPDRVRPGAGGPAALGPITAELEALGMEVENKSGR